MTEFLELLISRSPKSNFGSALAYSSNPNSYTKLTSVLSSSCSSGKAKKTELFTGKLSEQQVQPVNILLNKNPHAVLNSTSGEVDMPNKNFGASFPPVALADDNECDNSPKSGKLVAK